MNILGQSIIKPVKMKLFAFQPSGHGQASFFTIAADEEEARRVVDRYVRDKYVEDGKLDYMAIGWGTEYYRVTVVDPGQVIENDND